MPFRPFHVTPANIAYSCLGGFTVVFGMFSLLIREKLYIGEAIWAFLFGILVGPHGVHIFSPRDWGGSNAHNVTGAITLEVTRVVLAVGVFAIGVELPSKYMQKHARSLLFLLGPIMAIGWVVCAGLIYALIPPLGFISSLAIAACLTPTDPILAAAVVGGKYAEKRVPEHLRHLLYAESGCNDGAAFPFLFIALYIILEADDRVAVEKWFYITWAYEIILGIIIGALIGWGFRHLLKFCEARDLIDRKSYVAQYISLALLSNGITSLLGSDDLLAAFAAGTAFAWDSHFNQQTADSVFSSVIDLLFNVAVFVYIGAWMPFDGFNSEVTGLTVWRLVVLAILIILLRRIPIMIMLYKWIPDVQTFREALFSGHFGPMGVGAIFIATLAVEQLPQPELPPRNQTDILALSIEPVIAFMVMCSILIHGLSIPFFSLGRRVRSVTMSRTLSLRGRHEPEWATHTRKVTRPEDIVINRDREPEPSSVTENEMEEGRVGTSGSETDAAKAAEQALDYECEENDELVRKWREGRHLVIEHHSKEPGTEVQVEVIRNAFNEGALPNLKNAVHRFTAAPQSIRGEALKYLHAFTPRNSTDDTDEGATVPIQKLVESAIGRTSRPASVSSQTSKAVKISTPPEASGSKAPSVVADDENDEWEDESASEASEPAPEPPTYHSPPKKKPHQAPKGRRRESFRRSALDRRAFTVQPSSPSDSGDAAWPEAPDMPPPTPLRKPSLGQRPAHIRGGSEYVVIPPGDPSGQPRPTLHSRDSGSALRNRFDRLKYDEVSGSSSRARTRESSPARVVRFAAQSPPERTPAQTAPPSDDEYTPPLSTSGNTQSRFA